MTGALPEGVAEGLRTLEGILRDVAADGDVSGCHEDALVAIALVRRLLGEGEVPWCEPGEVVCGHVVDVAQQFGFRDTEGHWVTREEVRRLEPWRFRQEEGER